jgi:uncharacterized membrane protein YkoI
MQNLFSRKARTPGGFLSILAVLGMVLLPMMVFGQRSATRISAARAKSIALASYPGVVVSTRPTTRSGRTYYDVYVRSGQVRRHVLVNARTGVILAGKTGPRTRNARRIALAAHPGKVVAGPTPITYQGKRVQSVTVQSGVVRRTVLVNTQAGTIVKTMIRHTK